MKTPSEQNYINRLISCGYPCICAFEIYSLLKTQGEEELEQFVRRLEKEGVYVERIQP